MAFKYGSREFTDEILRKQYEDTELQTKLKGLTFNLILVGTDAPGNVDWQYKITLKDGKFLSCDVDIQPAPSRLRDESFDKKRFDSKAISDHRILYNLVTEKIDIIEVLQKVKVVGDFGKFISQIKGLTGLIRFLGTFDKSLRA
jgi:hypothetical protein